MPRPWKESDGFHPIEGTMHGAEESTGEGALTNVGRSAMGEIAGALDIPGNVTKWGLRQVGLGDWAGQPDYIRRKLAGVDVAYEPGKDPPGLATDIGKVVGTSLITAVPVVGAGARMSTTARVVASGLPSSAPSSVASGVMQSIGKFAVDHPAKFLAFELFSATSAGAVGHVAAKEFPDTPGARALGEILGGIGGPLTAAAAIKAPVAAIKGAYSATQQTPVLGPMVRGIRNMITPTLPGARARARERVGEFASRDEVEAGLRDPSTLPGAPLTPAQKTGNRNLLSLEKSVMSSTMELQAERRSQFSTLNTFLRDSMKGPPGQATPDDARIYFQTLIDSRLRIAAESADQRLTAIGPRLTREESNIVAREEIQTALQAGRAQERELWAAVPTDTAVPAATVRATFQRVLNTTPQAQMEDIPPMARALLEGDRPRIGETTTVAELQGLRSKLLEVSRIAREAKQFNQARIADDLAGSILEDLGAARNAVQGEVGNALRTALDFSADLNNRFTRGAVGRLLGYEKAGGALTPPGMTLESTIGRSGPRAREEADALLNAAERSGDQPVLRGYMEDYLKDEFRRKVVRDGRVNPDLGQSYLRDRQDLLGRFPQLRGDMETAVTTGMELRTAQRAADPETSAAAIFLRAPPGDEIKRVLQSSNPRAQMESLVTQARRDSTGNAEKGVKAAMVRHLFDSVATSQRDDLGERFIDGRGLREMLNNPKIREAVVGTFNPDERSRLMRIAETASRLDMAREAEAAPGGILKDGSSLLLTSIAGILGARVGRALNTGTIQGPGLMANLFRKLAGVSREDAAEKLIVAAVRDESLFRALYTQITSPKVADMVQSRLNAWAASVIRETGQSEAGETAQREAGQP